MPLNKACVGREYPPVTITLTADAMQKYARAYNDDNPAFFDAGRPGGIVAPPMVMMDPEVKVDLLRLVHGEQDMEFANPMRPDDIISATSKIVAIEDKSTGETMTVELKATNQKGQPVQKTHFIIFIRGTRSRSAAAAEARPVEPEHGASLLTVTQTIDKDQTYRYKEASGDPNPIHVDENVAKMAGLPGIIVHGLCTMAFTSKIAIDKLCAGDPTRLKRLRVRFSRPVLPGQTITTKVWADGERDGRKVFAFETFNPDGQAVIKGGLAEVAT
jgi:acyl dehydratase